jgi:hypothetical protein
VTNNQAAPKSSKSPTPNANTLFFSPAEANEALQRRLEEEAARPSEIARREAQAKEKEQTDIENAQQSRIDNLTQALNRAHADVAPAVRIDRKTHDDYQRRIAECRVSRGYLALPGLLDEFEAELPQRLAEIADAVRVVRERERAAEAVLERENARLSAAGMSDGQTLDWLEQQRFRLRHKGGKIQIAPIGGVNLRERVALQMHYAGILAILKNREDWGTVDALES